jgi:outer membrane protein assembly factor BamB
MNTDHTRAADALDRWWDSFQNGEITTGIPMDDMHLIQEITAMHAHAISTADDRRIWQQTMAQIRHGQNRSDGPIDRLLRIAIPWPDRGWFPAKLQAAAILVLMIVASLVISLRGGGDHHPAIFAPNIATPNATPLTGVPMYRGNAARTGVMPGPGPAATPGVIWQATLQGAITHQPLLVDGTIYIDDSGGWVYAIDAQTGSVTWQISTGVGGESALSAGDGMVYATTYNGIVLALDAETGQERWRDDRARPRFPVIVSNDRVILDAAIAQDSGEERGAVITLDAKTGEELDQFSTPEAFRNLVTISDGVIYGRATSGDAYAYDLATHTQLWRATVGSHSLAPITIADGVAFVPLGTEGAENQVVTLDAATGVQIWRRGTTTNRPFGAAIVTDGTFYAFAKDGSLYASNAADGVEQFTEAPFDDGWEVVGAPAYADGTIFVASQGGTLVGTRGPTDNGWRVSLPGRIDGGPIVAGGLLWVGTYEGVLYALGGPEEPQATPAETGSTPEPATPNATGAQVEWTSQSGLVYPIDTAVDSAGNAYVVDTRNGQIAVIGSDGKLVDRIGSLGIEPGQFQFSASDAGEQGGVDIGPDGLIYVADGFNSRVQVFDTNYQFLRAWGSAGPGEGQFNRPNDILVANDRVYVSDFGNSRVQIFTLDGKFVSQFGSFGSDDGQFSGPADLAANPDGNIYVGEVVGARIQRFSADGDYLGPFGDEWKFVEVWGIDIDSHGNLLAVDASADREQLLVFNPEGNQIAVYDTYDTGVSMYPTSLAISPDGSIYLTDWEGETNLVKLRIPEVTRDE